MQISHSREAGEAGGMEHAREEEVDKVNRRARTRHTTDVDFFDKTV